MPISGRLLDGIEYTAKCAHTTAADQYFVSYALGHNVKSRSRLLNIIRVDFIMALCTEPCLLFMQREMVHERANATDPKALLFREMKCLRAANNSNPLATHSARMHCTRITFASIDGIVHPILYL